MGNTLVEAYGGLAPGERVEVLLDGFSAGMRIGLVEAGIRHLGEDLPDGSVRVTLERGEFAALNRYPGLHHLVAGADGDVWCCERARRVARIDGDTGEVRAVAEVVEVGTHLSLDGAAGRLFTADAAAGEVVAMDAGTLEVLGRWPAPGGPQLPMVTAAGYVVQTGPATGTFTVLGPAGDGYRERTIPVGPAPHDPVALPDGETAFVPCAGSGVVVRVDLPTATVTGTFPVGDGPTHIAVHPDGRRLYVANTFSGDLVCLTADGRVRGRSESGGWSHLPVISPDGSLVAVANFLDDTVTLFDAESLEPVAVLATEPYPHDVVFSPDGSRLLVTGYSSTRVRIYDPSRRKELARVEVGRAPSHAAFMYDGDHAWVACSVEDRLVRVDVAAGTRDLQATL